MLSCDKFGVNNHIIERNDIMMDAGLIVLACVLANHLGLVSAIEQAVRFRLPILDCSKCCSFWCVLIYCITARMGVIHTLALSFLSALLAVWVELAFGYIDTLYIKIYGKIYGEDNAVKREDTTAEG